LSTKPTEGNLLHPENCPVPTPLRYPIPPTKVSHTPQKTFTPRRPVRYPQWGEMHIRRHGTKVSQTGQIQLPQDPPGVGVCTHKNVANKLVMCIKPGRITGAHGTVCCAPVTATRDVTPRTSPTVILSFARQTDQPDGSPARMVRFAARRSPQP
jgi:hypothetical protein